MATSPLEAPVWVALAFLGETGDRDVPWERPMGRPMGCPMEIATHGTSLSQVSPKKAKATQTGASSGEVATAHGLHVSNVFTRILSYSHVSRILDHGYWIEDPGILAWFPEPGPGPGPAQRPRHTCMGLEVQRGSD